MFPLQVTAGLGSYLYLCLGGKLEDLPNALVAKEHAASDRGRARDFVPTRSALFENGGRPSCRSAAAIEYDTADLAILLTGDSRFVDRLKDAGAIRPLLQWVKDGGRLVVSMHPETASTDPRRSSTTSSRPAQPC